MRKASIDGSFELWRKKEPSIDDFLKVRVALPLFFERAVIEITPERCLFWADGRTDRAAVASRAPRDEAA